MNRSEYTISIGPIINLADARFYAAFEFDNLLFDFRENSASKVSIDLFNEIKEWVTGIEFIAISETPISGIEKNITTTELNNLKRVEPSTLTSNKLKEFTIDISSLINEPLTHYDLVADWMEANFDF